MAMQGDELRRLRKASGLTQAQFGEAIGVTGGYLGLLERGERAIEDRVARAAHHAAAPIGHYATAHIPPDLGERANALLNDFAKLFDDDTSAVSGVVRLRTGELMVGMRHKGREG
jgi:transcriptional regulator with XRE-family HTH domain